MLRIGKRPLTPTPRPRGYSDSRQSRPLMPPNCSPLPVQSSGRSPTKPAVPGHQSIATCWRRWTIDAVVSSIAPRKSLIPHDRKACRQRNLVERLFAGVKDFRRVATRSTSSPQTSFLACLPPQSQSGDSMSLDPSLAARQQSSSVR
jgi:hypothetical protein